MGRLTDTARTAFANTGCRTTSNSQFSLLQGDSAEDSPPGINTSRPTHATGYGVGCQLAYGQIDKLTIRSGQPILRQDQERYCQKGRRTPTTRTAATSTRLLRGIDSFSTYMSIIYATYLVTELVSATN